MLHLRIDSQLKFNRMGHNNSKWEAYNPNTNRKETLEVTDRFGYGTDRILHVTENTWLPDDKKILVEDLRTDASVEQALQAQAEKLCGQGTKLNRIS